MSRIVASGVDFLLGITAADEGLVVGDSLGLLLAAGDEDFAGEGDAVGFGESGAVFSVVTEAVGSSDGLFSVGVAAGEGLCSWANANGAAAGKSAVGVRVVSLIRFSLLEFERAPG